MGQAAGADHDRNIRTVVRVNYLHTTLFMVFGILIFNLLAAMHAAVHVILYIMYDARDGDGWTMAEHSL